MNQNRFSSSFENVLSCSITDPGCLYAGLNPGYHSSLMKSSTDTMLAKARSPVRRREYGSFLRDMVAGTRTGFNGLVPRGGTRPLFVKAPHE